MRELMPPKPDEIAARQFEQAIFKSVAEGLAAGVRREGPWTKAFADADEAKVRALYIRYRAQAMLDEAFLKSTRPHSEPRANARYREGSTWGDAARADGRAECFFCHVVNWIDTGRPNRHCGHCRVPLC